MSSGGDSVFPKPAPPNSGVRAALQYTGIPVSWLDKRPSLPSRNWLIFLGVTGTVAGYYIYDRQQCKRIRQEYKDQVKDLADVPLGTKDLPRKVTVYGAKWLGDEDHDRSMKYFRKYVKPILVAAAIDYDMVTGRRLGDVARRVADDIREERRKFAGLDPPPMNLLNLPNSSPAEKHQRRLEGGIVIVGRHTLKEYMHGLKRGWTDGLQKVDREEQLAQALENDGKFDEPEPEPSELALDDDEPLPTPSKLPPSRPFSVLSAPNLRMPPPPPKTAEDIAPAVNAPPSTIPPQPPMLLVTFTNYIGLTQIPLMIWDFFNERQKVRAGAEAAMKLVRGATRPFTAPPSFPAADSLVSDFNVDHDGPQKPFLQELSPSDLDFDREGESWYKASTVRNYSSEIEKARDEYYKSLAKKLEVARALARGTREPTKEESENPPPTEVELRAERMKKELRWTSDEEGWDIVRPDKNVDWDERLRNILRVYTEPPPRPSTSFDAQSS
ncbi:inner membrane protein import complex subunit Tim54-domain-containing protein [Epithele typhae]|uniref:inner membrane protein import complex subunit Tim54-domain-containing protein n=1 Tax=Epithele typhae TaxID=378194 RepID=UPI002008DEEF|nr:inner membrane protein import complex subunit Tim54-domain-containing protein [Epithele typhae]KAH9945851.1 inner membrane protein import complex subunit Tim54-domain-containing protein [Epithele typhae]